MGGFDSITGRGGRWVVVLLVGMGLYSVPVFGADEQSQIDFANGLFARGFHSDAAEEYRSYLSSFPDGSHRLSASYRLGESELSLGQLEAALSSFDSVLNSGESGEFVERARLRKGVVLVKLDRPDDAIGVLGGLIGAEVAVGIRGEALYYLGKAHFEAGRVAEAIGAFVTLAHDVDAGSLSALGGYQLAFAYLARGDLEKGAVEFSEVANTEAAGDALRMESRFRAAEVYDKLGWFDAAVRAYDQLGTDFPGSEYADRARHGHGWALYHAGKPDEAMLAVREFIESNPESSQLAGMRYLLGNCLQQTGGLAESLGVYRDIQVKHEGSSFAHRSLHKESWVLYLSGDADAARDRAEAFLAGEFRTGLEGDSSFLLGMLFSEAGELKTAAGHFRSVFEAFPGSEFSGDALYRFGECSVGLKKYGDAADAFAQFAIKYPEHGRVDEARLRAGDARFALGEYGAAAEFYESVAEGGKAAASREEALYRLALTHHNARDFAASSTVFGRLIEVFPESRYGVEAQYRVGDYLLREGGEPLKAIEYFERAYALDSEGAVAGLASRGLALARYETKDFDGASQVFIRVIERWPTVALNEKTYAWVGQHLFDRGEWAQASVAMRALLANVPEYPNRERVLFKIAECVENAGDVGEALGAYGVVVEAAAGSESAWDAKYRMAQLYEGRGDVEDAIALYEEGAGAGTGETAARSRFRLGELYEGQEKFDIAARHFLRIAILYFHAELSPEALWRAGYCYERAGDIAQARETYGEVLRDYPESEQAGKVRERMASLEQG